MTMDPCARLLVELRLAHTKVSADDLLGHFHLLDCSPAGGGESEGGRGVASSAEAGGAGGGKQKGKGRGKGKEKAAMDEDPATDRDEFTGTIATEKQHNTQYKTK